MIFTKENGRTIGAPDKLFGVSQLAKARAKEIGKENVTDTTIGVLLNDEGEIVVLDSVMESIRGLSPADYAAYAPIKGVPEYIEAVKKAVFLDMDLGDIKTDAIYTPGGTGAIRTAVSCYTEPGDTILTGDWYWAPYKTIAREIGRDLDVYKLFDDSFRFNSESFKEAVNRLTEKQDSLLIIINTPAHNPTGYTFTDEDWDKVIEIASEKKDKKIIILCDIAYMDFSSDPIKNREFFKKLTDLPENILPLIAFSASKGFTMYGMRCGALVIMSKSDEVLKEFADTASVAGRGTWSNGNRAAMTVVADIFSNAELREKVDTEREKYRNMLKERGMEFVKNAEAEGLAICPYDSGFFVTVPCDNPELIGKELQKKDIFAIPFSNGIRVSVSSCTKEQAAVIPGHIKAIMNQINK